ncbi:MAG: hypothetical protein RL613_563 [Fusobacteriota bacterium]
MRDENYYKNKKAKREGKDNASDSKGFNPLGILGFLVGLLIMELSFHSLKNKHINISSSH